MPLTESQSAIGLTPPRSEVSSLTARGIASGGVTQLREMRSGSSYCSQNSFDLHFGVVAASEIQTLEIRWPGGRTSVERELAVDQTHSVREPASHRLVGTEEP